MSSCPDEERLVKYASGKAGEDRASIELHLDGCASCRILLRELLATSIPSSGQEAADQDLARVPERYQVLERLGAGGMGRVYLAYDAKLERRVALKVLRRAPAGGDPSTVLLREAQALARLSHPNVVQVYDLDSAGDEVFISMEFVEGQTLSAWLASAPRSWREVLKAFVRAGRGLAAVHQAGLVHRDFKQSNVLVGRDGGVRVSDFGLATLEFDAATASGPASLGGGTPAFVAPERYLGEPASARSDQFSFCAALYEALYGVGPFDVASLPELRKQILAGAVRPPPWKRAPAPLRRAVLRGLSVDPAHRFESMEACLEELSRPWWRRPQPVRALAAAALLACAAGAALYDGTREEPCERRVGHVDVVWSSARRERLRTGFSQAGGQAGELTFAAVERAVDQLARSWREAQRAACLTPDAAARAAQQGCLSQRLAELDALGRMLDQADRKAVFDAPRAVQALTHPDTCASALPAPTRRADPRLVDLGSLRAEVVALQVTGRYAQALALFPRALALAKALGQQTDEAELQLQLGQLLLKKGDFQAAEQPLFEALVVAQDARLDAVAAQSWLALGQRARLLANFEDAERWIRLAEASASHTGDPGVRLNALAARAALRVDRGELREAVEEHRRAVATAIELRGSEDPLSLQLRRGFAQSLFLAGRYEECLEVDLALLQSMSTAYGEAHPEVAMAYVSTSGALGALRRHREALDYAERARVLVSASLGEQSLPMVDVLNNLSVTYAILERFEESAVTLDQAISLCRTLLGDEHPKVARLMANRAGMLLNGGELEAAEGLLEESLALLTRLGRSDHKDSLPPLQAKARVQLARGAAASSLATARQASALAQKLELSESVQSGPQLSIGAALVDLGRAREALPYLERALSAVSAEPPERVSHLPSRELYLARALCETRTDCSRGATLAASALARLKDRERSPPELSRSISWARTVLARRGRQRQEQSVGVRATNRTSPPTP